MGENKHVKLIKNLKKFGVLKPKRFFTENINGFSLIEVIIAIAIIGIITVPISTIFIGSISETLESKEQLKANQVAQMYIEQLKSMSEEEIKSFFGDLKEKEISGINTDGLPVVPDGFTVELKYETDTYDDAFPNNELDAPQDLSGRDFKITIDSAQNNTIKINGTEKTVGSGSERYFDIIYDIGGKKIKFKDRHNDNIFYDISVTDSLEYFFIIDCVGTDDHTVDTKIYVYNETNDDVKVFIFEDKTTTIEPEIALDAGDGEVSVIYNQQKNESSADRRIYEIEAIVKKGTVELARYKASKITE